MLLIEGQNLQIQTPFLLHDIRITVPYQFVQSIFQFRFFANLPLVLFYATFNNNSLQFFFLLCRLSFLAASSWLTLIYLRKEDSVLCEVNFIISMIGKPSR